MHVIGLYGERPLVCVVSCGLILASFPPFEIKPQETTNHDREIPEG